MQTVRFSTQNIQDLLKAKEQELMNQFNQNLSALAVRAARSFEVDAQPIFNQLVAASLRSEFFEVAEGNHTAGLFVATLDGHKGFIDVMGLGGVSEDDSLHNSLAEIVSYLFQSNPNLVKLVAHISRDEVPLFSAAGFKTAGLLQDDRLIQGELVDTVIVEKHRERKRQTVTGASVANKLDMEMDREWRGEEIPQTAPRDPKVAALLAAIESEPEVPEAEQIPVQEMPRATLQPVIPRYNPLAIGPGDNRIKVNAQTYIDGEF